MAIHCRGGVAIHCGGGVAIHCGGVWPFTVEGCGHSLYDQT